jgi:3-isopropylmalate/(R)-2-methylmalate dehydratase small subunit
MEQFTSISGIAAPLMQINIDTDQIIPARYLGGTDAKGYGAHLFANWRFLPDGSPDPAFILNQEPYSRAAVLLADRNFGCGSSRERAPKALREFGIRSIIAPSFGGIFYNNCFRNGIVPVNLPIEQVREILAVVEAGNGLANIAVDLDSRTVSLPDGRRFDFEVPEMLRQMLLLGVDEIDQTKARKAEIDRFREGDRARRPWIYIDAAPISGP